MKLDDFFMILRGMYQLLGAMMANKRVDSHDRPRCKRSSIEYHDRVDCRMEVRSLKFDSTLALKELPQRAQRSQYPIRQAAHLAARADQWATRILQCQSWRILYLAMQFSRTDTADEIWFRFILKFKYEVKKIQINKMDISPQRLCAVPVCWRRPPIETCTSPRTQKQKQRDFSNQPAIDRSRIQDRSRVVNGSISL